MEGRCPLFGGEKKSFCTLCSVVEGDDIASMSEQCARSIIKDSAWDVAEIKTLLSRMVEMGKTGDLPLNIKAGLMAFLESNMDLSEHGNDVVRLVGNAYAFLGYNNKAMESFEFAIQREEDDVTALNNLGVLLARTGKESEAIECYETVLEKDSENENAWFNLGKAHSRMGKFNKAAHCFQMVVDINPKNISAWNNLGVSLRASGKTKDAIDCYISAITLKKDYKWAWNNMGIAYLTKRKYKKAAESFRKALVIDPDFKEAKEGLAACGGK
jgi:tetratricopeptide (TPR) repeat protein